MGSDILTTIDDTLTFHSAALGEDLTVAVEREEEETEFGQLLAEWHLQQLATTVIDVDYFAERGVSATTIAEVLARHALMDGNVYVVAKSFMRAERARRARLRRMHHLYRMRRRPW